jgi:hypothetical protein
MLKHLQLKTQYDPNSERFWLGHPKFVGSLSVNHYNKL